MNVDITVLVTLVFITNIVKLIQADILKRYQAYEIFITNIVKLILDADDYTVVDFTDFITNMVKLIQP